MKTRKPVAQCVAFIVVLVLVIYAIPGQLFGINSIVNYAYAKDYYKEKKGTLDAVFVGASNVYQFWQPAIGWQHRGIAVINLSFSSLPIMSFSYLIAEARKTQPDALYIINLNTFKNKRAADKIEKFHTVIDYMPLSLEKIRFIQTISKISGFSFNQQMELMFPFIRFHSRWNELKSWSYGTRDNKVKNSSLFGRFLREVVDLTGKLTVYDTRVEPDEDVIQVFTELLEYLDREHVNALFVKVPQAMNEQQQGHLYVLEDILKARGYPCLDIMKDSEACGINPQRDFYNRNHTNIHGSLKVTEYLADYLVEHYHFADKRGQADYADWDRAGKAYDALIDSWILPFEREKNLWHDLNAPKLKKPVVGKNSIRLTWSASKGADGYVIYRKTTKKNGGKWKLLATVGAEKRSYSDKALKANTNYTYRVAPFVDKDGQKAYGDYEIKGASCTSPKKLGRNSKQNKSGR